MGIFKQKNYSLLRYFLLLSLLVHALLFVTASLQWKNNTSLAAAKKMPSMEVPAYFYRGALASTNNQQQPEKKSPIISKKKELSLQKEKPTINPNPRNSVSQQASSKKKTEPIHLIGDKKTAPTPLIKILGQSVTAHLIYPKIAVDFKLRGIVYVGFSIHPDGRLTGIEVVQSSRAGVLDEAALTAVKGASPLHNIASYVDKTRYMVVGIIFR